MAWHPGKCTLMELKWKLGLKMAANVEITALATLAIVNEKKKLSIIWKLI